MAKVRKTLSREILVKRVNETMKSDLSPVEKLAIADYTASLLLNGNTYLGYYVKDLGRLEGESHHDQTLREVSTREYF